MKTAKRFRSTGSVFLNPPSNGERTWKKQACPRYQYLAPGLEPVPELCFLLSWKSLRNISYARA